MRAASTRLCSRSRRLARQAELTVAALDAVAGYDWGTVARDVLSVYETVVLGRSTVGIVE